MTNREKAFQMYKESKGKKTLVDIAEELGVAPGTVRGWKSKNNWDDKMNGTERKKKRNVPDKKVQRSRTVERNVTSPKLVPNDELEDITDINEYYGITEQQRRFADEYIETSNIYQSAVKSGYSHNYANARGWELLGLVGIKNYINDRMKVLSHGKIATQEEVLQHLTKVMSRQEAEHQVVTLREREEQWEPVDDGKGSTQLKKKVIEKETPKIVSFPTKVSDANKAAELLGKRYGVWSGTKTETESKGIVVVDAWDDEDD